MTRPETSPQQNQRQQAMAVLAHMPTERIAACLGEVDVPPHEALRQPENGLVMVRGRIGGDGAPFNLGEASVSRAAVRLSSGEVGFGYVLGRDGEKARLIALCDALIQSDAFRDRVEANGRGTAARGTGESPRAAGCRDGRHAGRFLYTGARRGLRS